MEMIRKESSLLKYNDESELNDSDRQLLLAAKEAVGTSYAPYSKFHVGCALLLENGVVIKGSNQENIAFPSGLCAERVAVFQAGANYPGVAVVAMAVTVKADDHVVAEPIMSCGACLQSLSEFEMKSGIRMRTILQGEKGAIYVAEKGTETFMPFQFETKALGK